MELVATAPQVGFLTARLTMQTSRARQFIDLTDRVLGHIQAAGINNGLAVVASQHTTAAVLINEHEPELLKDLDAMLTEMAPEDRPYAHNEVPCVDGQKPNGHAHCQALLLCSSATIPIVNGKAVLGRYQRIFLVELDCARLRTVTVTVLGV